MIDTHTHLNFQAFEKDWSKVVDRAVKAGVTKMIVVGTDLESSQKAVDMANSHPALYAAVGIHPHHARQIRNQKSEIRNLIIQLENLAQHPKVIAIGECGLDYHRYQNTKYQILNTEKEWSQIKSLQQELLQTQLSLAQSLDKPVILHSREASEDILHTLRTTPYVLRTNSGVFHCFDGSHQYLKKIIEAGFYVSFTGNITYNSDRATLSTLVPSNRLLLETDCPFMLPEPLRSKNYRQPLRSEPQDVKIIAQSHADMRKIQLDEVVKSTTQNALRLFHF